MNQVSHKVLAGSAPAADVPKIDAETPYQVQLADQSAVTFVVLPGKPTRVNGAYGGLLRFRVARTGLYRVSLTSGHWIDIVDGQQLMSAKDFQGQPGCTGPHKIVEYELPAGHELTLQLSGSPDPVTNLVITAVAAAKQAAQR